MFAEARHTWFEDGVESEFSRAFSTLVHLYGNTAVSAAESLLSSPSTNIEVGIEAAHGLGEIDHPRSLRYRRSLLERLLLTAPSVRLRHGAAAGLASMDDPSSLPAVSEAYACESNQRLRQYLQLVVEQLERTRACRTS
jgi:HEAT repeat protein